MKLTDEQKEKLNQVLDERGEARRGLGFGAPADARQAFDQEWNAKILEILTAEQKEAWEKLLGPPPAAAAETPESSP